MINPKDEDFEELGSIEMISDLYDTDFDDVGFDPVEEEGDNDEDMAEFFDY